MSLISRYRWDLLSDAAQGPMVGAALARMMGPQALCMNLNTLLRHGVFNVVDHSVIQRAGANERGAINDYMVEVADRIADESEIRRSKTFPYQYFAAYFSADDNVVNQLHGDYHPFVARSTRKVDRFHHLSTYRKLSPYPKEYVDAGELDAEHEVDLLEKVDGLAMFEPGIGDDRIPFLSIFVIPRNSYFETGDP